MMPLSIFVWKLDDRQPEVLNRFNHMDKLIQIDGFGDVAVGVQIVRFENIDLVV
jgi:hypothetical protein